MTSIVQLIAKVNTTLGCRICHLTIMRAVKIFIKQSTELQRQGMIIKCVLSLKIKRKEKKTRKKILSIHKKKGIAK